MSWGWTDNYFGVIWTRFNCFRFEVGNCSTLWQQLCANGRGRSCAELSPWPRRETGKTKVINKTPHLGPRRVLWVVVVTMSE